MSQASDRQGHISERAAEHDEAPAPTHGVATISDVPGLQAALDALQAQIDAVPGSSFATYADLLS